MIGFAPYPSSNENAYTLGMHRNSSMQQMLKSVYAGNCCRVLGPRYHNKSKLMHSVETFLNREETHYAIYINLAHNRRENESYFYNDIHSSIRKSLPSSLISQEVEPCQSAIDFQRALITWSKQSDRNIALLVDEVETAPPNLAASLLGVLRAVFTTVVDQPGARFQAIVCGSLSLSQVALANASRFENVSDLILVTELDSQERNALVHQRCREANITPMETGVEALLAETGGDLYLIEAVTEICFSYMQQYSLVRLTSKRAEEAIEAFLNNPYDWQVLEALRQIELNPSLLSCALHLLKHKESSVTHLPIDNNETPTALDLCSAFRRVGNDYRIKSPLWDTLLERHLTARLVGGLYAIAGDWKQAITYLGKAIQQDARESISELFAAIINAIHASDTIVQAWEWLGQGLHALYPQSDVHLYARQIASLRPVYPANFLSDGRILLLKDTQDAEVDALSGPEYSLADTSIGTRLIFPLRTSPAEGNIVGLASFRSLTDSTSPYEQKEVRTQLASFLLQAARAIKAKSTFREILDASTRRNEKLNTLNQILTGLLHRRSLEETQVLRVVMEGLTHGWGLEFNRAMLFVPDEHEQRLVGDLAIGHLTRQEAEEEWEIEPYDRQTAGEWLSTLFAIQKGKIDKHLKLQKELQTIEIQLANNNDPLAQCYHQQYPLHNSQTDQSVRFSPNFDRIIQPPADFAIVPLRAGTRSLGIIYVDNKFTGRNVSLENYELLQTFVNQVALIIENSRTLARRTQELKELSRELQTGLQAHSESEIEEIFRSTLQSARNRTNAPYLYLIRNEPYDQWRVFRLMDSGELYRQDENAPPSQMLVDASPKESILCTRAQTSKTAQVYQFFHADAQCGVEVPVVVNHNCLAVLHLESPNPEGCTTNHQEYLEYLASRLTLTLVQFERVQALRQLLETSLQLTRKKDLGDLLQSLVEKAMQSIRTVSAITLYYVTSGQLVLGPTIGILDTEGVADHPPDRRTIIEHVWRLDKPIFETAVTEASVLYGPFVQREEIISAAAFPLVVNDNRVGCMFFNYRIHHVFDEGERSLLALIAQLAAVAIHQAQLNEELQRSELWEGISRLSIGMIHDVNSAIASIPDLADELEINIKTGKDITAPLKDLRRNIEETAQLSEHMRTYVIHQQFKTEPIQLDTLIQDTVRDLTEHKPSHITIFHKVNGPLPKIEVDPLLLNRLLQNLLVNAWEAIPPDRQGAITIALEIESERSQVFIRVRDNGQGIAKENIHRIFDPDYTTKSGRVHMHGIGLSYCKQIAKEHGGDLSVEWSRIGEGTSFIVILPIWPMDGETGNNGNPTDSS